MTARDDFLKIASLSRSYHYFCIGLLLEEQSENNELTAEKPQIKYCNNWLFSLYFVNKKQIRC